MKNSIITILIFLMVSIVSHGAAPAADTVVIDDNRNLQFNDETTLTIDRRPISQDRESRAAEQFGTGFLSRTIPGFNARIDYAPSGNPGSNGDLSDINLLNSVVGPVTANSDGGLQVLFVDLVVDADTVIEGVDDVSQINLGDIVAASGMQNEDGTLKVTRLEYFAEDFPYWLITGDIANLNDAGFDIGGQHVSTDNLQNIVSIIHCQNQNQNLENGLKVIVDLQPSDNYTTGDALDALAIICYQEFEPPVEPPNYVFFNGDIETINDEFTQITVAGYTVNITDTTQIIAPNSGDNTLEVGINVSVDGYLDEETGEVVAEYIIVNRDDPELPPPLPIVVSGEVSDVTQDSFIIDAQTINFGNDTQYINGTVADLIDGVLIEVIAMSEGINNPVTQLNAMQITFLDGLPPGLERLVGTISALNDAHTQFFINNEAVEISAQTVFMGTTVEEIANGLAVIVEGVRDAQSNNLVANFIIAGGTPPIDPPSHVCLFGTIESVNAGHTQFTIQNGQTVNVTENTMFLEGTQQELIVGATVNVSGIISDETNEVDAEMIIFEVAAPGPYVFFSGFISAVTEDGSQITVGDNIVNITDETQITGGSIENLVEGVEVQVEGVVDAETGEINAALISIPVETVAAAAPVLPEDIVLSVGDTNNGIVTIMGIEVHQNELTWDINDLFTNGLSQETTVIFFGYQDDDGTVWASYVFVSAGNDGGNQNGGDGQVEEELFVSGAVTGTQAGLMVMGVTIQSTDDAVYLDGQYQAMTQEEFMNSINIGDSISIQNGVSYDRESNTLTANLLIKNSTSIAIPNSRATSNRAEGDAVTGSGIVTRVIEDVIYKDAF